MSRSNTRNARKEDEDDKSELPPITPQEEREYGRVSTWFLPFALVKLVIAAWTKDEGGYRRHGQMKGERTDNAP